MEEIMKSYLVTFGYEDGEPKQMWIDASGKIHAALILKRLYGNQIYVREIEEFEYCDDKENEELTKILDNMTEEDLEVVRSYEIEVNDDE